MRWSCWCDNLSIRVARCPCVHFYVSLWTKVGCKDIEWTLIRSKPFHTRLVGIRPSDVCAKQESDEFSLPRPFELETCQGFKRGLFRQEGQLMRETALVNVSHWSNMFDRYFITLFMYVFYNLPKMIYHMDKINNKSSDTINSVSSFTQKSFNHWADRSTWYNPYFRTP